MSGNYIHFERLSNHYTGDYPNFVVIHKGLTEQEWATIIDRLVELKNELRDLEIKPIKTIYTASKTKHAAKWRDYRARWFNIISTWIDEAGNGETKDLKDLAERCVLEASLADVTILYCEKGEILKGTLLEAGAALSNNKLVYQVGDCDSISKVFQNHPNWRVWGGDIDNCLHYLFFT